MTASRAAVSAFALSLALLAGCGPATPTSAPPPREGDRPKESGTGIHIETPERNIDIKAKGTTGRDGDHGSKVDVNVTTKR